MSAEVCVNGRQAKPDRFGYYASAGPYAFGWRSCQPPCEIADPSHLFRCLQRES